MSEKMKRITKFILWLFWNIVYAFKKHSTDFGDGMVMIERCVWPRTFKPYVRHNDDGNMWHVYFTDERDYVQRQPIDVEVHIGEESGDIVGLTIWDETLAKKTMDEKSPEPDATMERRCLKAHREGRSRLLQEFIDELAEEGKD